MDTRPARGLHGLHVVSLCACLAAVCIVPLGAQTLPEPAVAAGFFPARGKTIAPFNAKALDGSPVDMARLEGSALLIHVWSSGKDRQAEGPHLAATVASTFDTIDVLVVTAEAGAVIQDTLGRAGVDPSMVIPDAVDVIRAAGSPSAPAWLFVAGDGRILAYRLGRLAPETVMPAIAALVKIAPRRPEPVPDAVAPAPPPVAVVPAGSESSGMERSGDPSAGAVPVVRLNAGLTDADFADSLETGVVAELNLARTQPAAYADILRAYRSQIRGRYLQRGDVRIILNEGATAVDEAIRALESARPLPPLSLSRGLSLAAADHAADQGRTGRTGHGGSDGSTMASRIERHGTWLRTIGENIAYGPETARDVVIQLIVDDGVPSRGHRKNIFNPDFLVVGIACGPHASYGTVCVQDFAWGFEER